MCRPSHLVAFVLLIVVGGCATVPSNPSRLDLNDGEAIILASATMIHDGAFFSRAGFVFDGPRRFRLDSAVPRTIHPMVEATPDPGLESVNGRLYAFAVPAGRYQLRAITLSGEGLEARPPQPVGFDAPAGAAVYIGDLQVTLCHLIEEESGAPYYVMGGHPSILDRRDRDLPMLHARHPELAGRPITNAVLDDRAVRDRYHALSRKCPGRGP